MVATSAVLLNTFHTVNGLLMGTYLSLPPVWSFLANAFAHPMFWLGLALWAAGFAHETLLNIRRNAKKADDDDANDGKAKPKQEHYAIPHGLLYRFISDPNYFCEWVE
ncbi:hypothetical protein BD311DRAFT_707199, partial [Dichomitus squalens]